MAQKDEFMSTENKTDMEREENRRVENRREENRMEENRRREEEQSTKKFQQNLLLNESEAEEYRAEWREIQTQFVDDPRDAVDTADELVADLMDTISDTLAEQRELLERQWGEGTEPSTEELRKTMMRYRSFFNRLLTLESTDTDGRME